MLGEFNGQNNNKTLEKLSDFFSEQYRGPHLPLIENFCTFVQFPAYQEGDTGERVKREELRKGEDYML